MGEPKRQRGPSGRGIYLLGGKSGYWSGWDPNSGAGGWPWRLEGEPRNQDRTFIGKVEVTSTQDLKGERNGLFWAWEWWKSHAVSDQTGNKGGEIRLCPRAKPGMCTARACPRLRLRSWLTRAWSDPMWQEYQEPRRLKPGLDNRERTHFRWVD